MILIRSTRLCAVLTFLSFAASPLWAGTPGSPEQQRAVSALEQAVKGDVNNAELWVHLGFAYRKMDQMDRAISAFEKAVLIDPRNQESLYMLGLIYEKKNQKAEALRAWKQYLAAASDPEKRSVAQNHIHQLSQ